MKLEYIKELTIGFMYEIMDEDKAMKKEQHVQKNEFIHRNNICHSEARQIWLSGCPEQRACYNRSTVCRCNT